MLDYIKNTTASLSIFFLIFYTNNPIHSEPDSLSYFDQHIKQKYSSQYKNDGKDYSIIF